MGAYIVRRLLQAIPTVFGVALLTFLLFNAFGPDPVRAALGNHATVEAIANLRHQWGLDQSLPMQFVDFLRQIVTFDYGKSYVTGDDLGTQLKSGALVSLSVTVPPFVFGAIVNVSLALFITRHRDGIVDRAARALFIAAMSVSALVYVLALQYLLAFKLDWFPINGYEQGWAAVKYLALPWLIQLLLLMGPDIRLYRTLFLQDINADWVRTARSKGAGEGRVLFRHVLPNAWIPIITQNVTTIPFLILGSFLMERFFSIPGIGNLTIDALSRGDLPILKAVTVMGALALVLFNLVNDLLYAVVDPRVRLSPSSVPAAIHAKPRLAAMEALVALWRMPHIRACMLVVLAYLLVALAGYAHLLPDHEASVGDAQQPPSWHLATLLGTDILGRSVLWRVLAGAQTAVTIGLVTTALAVPFGTALGLAAGYFGGWVDAVINWVYSVVVSVPDILLITAISYALGKGLTSMCVAIAATSWVSIMRLVRGEVLRHQGSDYVLAARSLGAGARRIMFSEILPNVIHVAIVTSSLVLLAAVKGEVILTYLGLGVQDGASWGLLIAGASQDLTNDVWGPLAGTVVAMFLLIYSLSAIGDALRDVLDPRVV